MTTLLTVFGSILLYCLVATSVCRRVGWYMLQNKKSYTDTDEVMIVALFISYLLLPIALAMMVSYKWGNKRGNGTEFWLAPRQERMKKRIEELERELDIG